MSSALENISDLDCPRGVLEFELFLPSENISRFSSRKWRRGGVKESERRKPKGEIAFVLCKKPQHLDGI